MEYATMTFWLLVIVFTALGVHQLWSSMVHPKVVNSVLLPGTLVAQLGHILGLLVTGGTVNDTTLITDDESGEPQTGTPKPRIPIIGAVVTALLPMVGCAVAIYWVSRYLGSQILTAMPAMPIEPPELPNTLPHFFALLHRSLSLVEQLVTVIRGCKLDDWHILLFLYLAICLTVRMAPLTGNVRGALGAIFITGILAFLIDRIIKSSSDPLSSVWPLITFSAAVLLLLLMVSLLVKAIVGLVKTCFG